MERVAYWWACVTPYRRMLLAILWIVCGVCLVLMKKKQPDTFWAYLAYVAVVEISFTAFAIGLSVAELGT